jgi:hypothetical protein
MTMKKMMVVIVMIIKINNLKPTANLVFKS